MENKLNKIKIVLGTILSSTQKINHNPDGLTLSEFERFFDAYASKFEKTLESNGKKYTLELFKELHNQASRLVTKEPWSPIPYHKSSKEGVSTVLLPVLRHLRSDRYSDIRIILSVTRLHESIRLKTEIDLTPIVSSYKGSRDLGEFTTEFSTFLQNSPEVSKILNTLPRLKSSNQLIGRIRSGPNGQSIVTSHYDAVALKEEPELYNHIIKYNTLLNQEYINNNLKWCINTSLPLELPPVSTGKLSAASERAGKTRLFAVGDYWSQNSLQTLHDWLMKILKAIPTDATYDQSEGFERILNKKVGYMASFDISKFTCRVPLRLQTVMLSYYTDHDLAHNWEGIVSKRGFRTPNGDSVRWSVGQPLGLLSSWATCTLLHHHLVWFASFRHFKDFRPFKGYEILGDDIVIWHKGVAESYACLLEELGIEINYSKSKLYDNSKEMKPIFEFAKRQGVNGNEISGIPYDLLKVATESIYNYVDLVLHLVDTKLLKASGDLDLPDYLSYKGKYYLEILLWEKQLRRPQWIINQGNAFDETTLLNALRKEIAKVRLEGFRELIRKLDELCYSSNLEKELQIVGVAHSDVLIGYSSDYYHPIIHSLNDVGMKMYETLPILDAIAEKEISGYELTLPELTEVEYLPLPYMKAHFERPGKRNPERLRKHSQLVLTATKQLKESPYGFILLQELEPTDHLPGKQ